jgi:protein-export membrane protein SecD
MFNYSKTRISLILAVCFLGIFFSIPNFLGNSDKLPNWWQPVNLGLDLQGGSNLLLKVDIDNVISERMNSLEDSARQTLREKRIRYKNLESKSDRVIVNIIRSEQKINAKTALRSIDSDIEVLDNEDGSLSLSYKPQSLVLLKHKVVEQSIEIVRRRIDELGTKEPVIQKQGDDRILVQLPGLQNPDEVKSLLGKTAKMSFHLVDNRSSVSDARRGRISPSSKLIPGAPGSYQDFYVVERKVSVGGEHLVDSQPTFQEGNAVVSFKFDSIGGKKFNNVTRKNIGRNLAIVLDNEVISAPTIQGAIGDSGIISGNFTVESANELALLLRSGALPAPLEVLEERTVGAGLGLDSIKAGSTACVIGIAAVVVFMILAYGLFGAFTTVTVLVNMCLLLGTLSFLGATLTLPGIAGIVLTIGMAVDANVLFFERMREEWKLGKTAIKAAETGFSNAMSTIVDANLTTLVAAIVLFYFGTGPVRGFAVTLAVGIFTSLFSSIMVTKLIVAMWIKKFKPQKLPI